MQAEQDEKLEDAICHAVNYHGLDAKLGMPDHVIAKLLWPEVSKHLRGVTDVQIIAGMTEEERRQIGAYDWRAAAAKLYPPIIINRDKTS